MKINLKNLKGQKTTLQLLPQNSILQLKQKIKQDKGIDVDQQKFVYKGKILTNEQILNTLNYKQQDFFMFIVDTKKQKQQKKQQKNQQSSLQVQPIPKKEQNQIQNQVKQEKQEQKQPVDPSLEYQINALIQMGFQRQKIIQALLAAQNNSQLAIDYLLNGLPQKNTQNKNIAANYNPPLQQFENNPAIQRLMALGFQSGDAIEAFLACDENQEMAANFLLERQLSGDLQEGQG